MSLIPNKKNAAFLTQRQIKRKQQQQIKKIESKFGRNIPLPTEDEIAQYIANKTNTTFEWEQKQDESQTS